jgi:hypothetical protein
MERRSKDSVEKTNKVVLDEHINNTQTFHTVRPNETDIQNEAIPNTQVIRLETNWTHHLHWFIGIPCHINFPLAAVVEFSLEVLGG